MGTKGSRAAAMVQRLMDVAPGDWRDLIEAMRLQRNRQSALDAAREHDDDAAR